MHREQYKSAGLYLVIVTLWVVLTAAAVVTSWSTLTQAWQRGTTIGVLVTISLAFIAYFWLNGVKDVMYTACYHLSLKRRPAPLPAKISRAAKLCPRVALVYCTRNDFNPASLLASMRQDYPNFWVAILDDSTEPAYLAQIDAFAAEHDVRVIRRSGNAGFKAGNLNNYLQRRLSAWQYFVILDSDEIIPPDFTSRALDYMEARPGIGIVQANHRATRNRNPFMRRFAIGVDSHWMAYQTVKDRFGFMSLLGHGAMVSRDCFKAVGGFPHVVAEDICLSIAARKAGFKTVFASDIMCEEEYPVDYQAFKKRHNKWTEGNMEFIRRYTGVIFKSNMSWYEKLDIVLFTYSLPLTALFFVYVMINVIAFPLMHYRLQLPLWMLAPTLLFLVAPMLNDIVFYYGKMKTRHLVVYLFDSTILYGSMFFVSLRASIKSAFGKSTFVVTPKDDHWVTFREGLKTTRVELTLALLLGIVVIIIDGNIVPVLLITGTVIASIRLITAHHQREEAPAE